MQVDKLFLKNDMLYIMDFRGCWHNELPCLCCRIYKVAGIDNLIWFIMDLLRLSATFPFFCITIWGVVSMTFVMVMGIGL